MARARRSATVCAANVNLDLHAMTEAPEGQTHVVNHIGVYFGMRPIITRSPKDKEPRQAIGRPASRIRRGSWPNPPPNDETLDRAKKMRVSSASQIQTRENPAKPRWRSLQNLSLPPAKSDESGKSPAQLSAQTAPRATKQALRQALRHYSRHRSHNATTATLLAPAASYIPQFGGG